MNKLFWLLLLPCMVSCFNKHTSKTGLEGKPMPSLDLLMTDSITRLNTASIPAGSTTVLFSFEPWCPYCRAETEELVAHMQSMSHVSFYMLCSSPPAELKKFYDHFELKKYPNIHVGVDDSTSFGQYFKTDRIPYLAVYDKQKKLKQVLVGKTDVSKIREAVSE